MKKFFITILCLFTIDFIGNTIIVTNTSTNEQKIIHIDPRDIESGNIDTIVNKTKKELNDYSN